MAPRIADVVRSLRWTHDNLLAPNVEGSYAQSLSVTAGLMLRHLEARIEHEGPALWADNADLRAVLASIRDRVPTVAAEIDAVARRPFRRSEDYPTLASLVDEAEALRTVLSHTLDALWAADDAGAHDEVRQYLSRQLLREAPWMADVFVGEQRR